MEESCIMIVENDLIDDTHIYRTNEYMEPINDYESINYLYELEQHNYDMEYLNYHHYHHEHPIHTTMPLTMTPMFTMLPNGWHCQTLADHFNHVMQPQPIAIGMNVIPQQLIYETKCNYANESQTLLLSSSWPMPPPSSVPPAAPAPASPQMPEFIYHTLQPRDHILTSMVLLTQDEDQDANEVEMTDIINDDEDASPEFYECEMDGQQHCYDNVESNIEHIDDEYEMEADNNGIINYDENDNGNDHGKGNDHGNGNGMINAKRNQGKNIYRAKGGYLVEEPSDDEPLKPEQ